MLLLMLSESFSIPLFYSTWVAAFYYWIFKMLLYSGLICSDLMNLEEP